MLFFQRGNERTHLSSTERHHVFDSVIVIKSEPFGKINQVKNKHEPLNQFLLFLLLSFVPSSAFFFFFFTPLKRTLRLSCLQVCQFFVDVRSSSSACEKFSRLHRTVSDFFSPPMQRCVEAGENCPFEDWQHLPADTYYPDWPSLTHQPLDPILLTSERVVCLVKLELPSLSLLSYALACWLGLGVPSRISLVLQY